MARTTRGKPADPDLDSSLDRERALRIGQAAELLGVGIDTLRRWEASRKLRVIRTTGGQRIVPILEVSRLLAERRRDTADRPIVAQSARNRFAGIVTRVERDGVAAVVEVLAGPHRLVSLMTAEAVDELDITIGQEVVCVVKSTNVIVEIPR
ncbi:MAG TPA: TOBE domain-containing protein [Candidatus Limnocylindrales bacterium]|nr:TOBE domain-containing protein [Candidatus Limnocylindrales bacterium]